MPGRLGVVNLSQDSRPSLVFTLLLLHFTENVAAIGAGMRLSIAMVSQVLLWDVSFE